MKPIPFVTKYVLKTPEIGPLLVRSDIVYNKIYRISKWISEYEFLLEVSDNFTFSPGSWVSADFEYNLKKILE